MTTARFSRFLLAALLVGCADRTATEPGLLADRRGESGEHRDRGRPDITVMTQNLYVGADVDAVIGALASPDPTDDLPALLFAIETLGKTDFPARAEAIADEIARTRPHAVGLQEVSVIDIDLRPLGAPIVLNLDFLAILQDALARRGLNYRLAAEVQNIVAVPLPGMVSLVDNDALLVDADRVHIRAAGGQNFRDNVGTVAPGIELKRGWVWAQVVIAGGPYTIVSTHAEADLGGASLDGLRALQMTELVGSVASDARVIMMGDFNDVPGSLMHQVITGAGFTDVWAALRPGTIGYTCCHLPDLSNPVAVFSKRIDYVFARGLNRRASQLSGEIDLFGDAPTDRVPGPAYLIWPSDHAGVTATLAR